MKLPTLDTLKRALEAHNALDFNQRIFDDPPEANIPRKCRGCGQQLGSLTLGWQEIERLVANKETVPQHLDSATCQFCEPDDEE